ncbi:hypothetical protein [Halodesulfovibrio aestuarii]|uniref:Zinc finger CHC2-type domain-containing protein n=1 Tax=Halodesulfovibrio aestuarii TaxID=126333 RepID=A0ABV4JW55_9BACT
MGYALEFLGHHEREVIARSVLQGIDENNSTPDKIAAHCPMHVEGTPGGAFFYNVIDDIGGCFSCGQSTDLIGLYNLSNGREPGDPDGMREFIKEYGQGQNGDRVGKSRARNGEFERTIRLKPEEKAPQVWSDHALKFAKHCNEVLLNSPDLLEQLWNWGIQQKTVEEQLIGWNPERAFRPYTSWGLPYEENENGKERCIMLPAGFVFPCLRDGVVTRMQIRREDGQPKYYQIKGGGKGPVVFGNLDSKIFVLVETIRDAELAYQELKKYGVAVIALGGASIRPTEELHNILNKAELLLVALDTDPAGAINSYHFEPWNNSRFAWMNVYPNAVRWPVPKQCGKDLGDLAATPVTVEQWFLAGLPDHVKKKISLSTATQGEAQEKEQPQVEVQDMPQEVVTPVVQQDTLLKPVPSAKRIVKPLPQPEKIPIEDYKKIHGYAHPRGAKLALEKGKLEIQWRQGEDKKLVNWGKRSLAGQPSLVAILTRYMEAA